ncbi:MAG: hypothetical protein O6928_03850 [Gammaproteobacteria bacterium]|nr:hypothetical protein [Gammaproteobacteria bacterium]
MLSNTSVYIYGNSSIKTVISTPDKIDIPTTHTDLKNSTVMFVVANLPG